MSAFRTAPLWCVAILLVGAALYFAALGKPVVRIKAEERCLDIVSAMVRTNSYVVPRLGGQVHVHKPPLFYWLAAVSCKLRGAVTLGAFRAPSALAGILTLIIALLWAEEVGNVIAAVSAAALLSVTFLFALLARRGSFEALFAFGCGASLLVWFKFLLRGGTTLGIAATLLFALTLMTKATPAFLFAPLPIAIWIIFERRFSLLRSARLWGPFLAGTLLGFAWYFYLLIFRPETRSTIFAELFLPFGVETQAEHSVEHFKPFHFFIQQIWSDAFPLSIALLFAVWRMIKTRLYRGEPAWRLLALAFIVPIIVLSIMPQKQEHYMLPAFLPLALICGRTLVELCAGLTGPVRAQFRSAGFWLIAITTVCLVGYAAGVAFLLHVVAGVSMSTAVGFGIVIGVISLFAGHIAVRKRQQPGGALGYIGVAATLGAFLLFVQPVQALFGSGQMYDSPTYNAAVWQKKFAKYRFLRGFLDAGRGAEHTSGRKRSSAP